MLSRHNLHCCHPADRSGVSFATRSRLGDIGSPSGSSIAPVTTSGADDSPTTATLRGVFRHRDFRFLLAGYAVSSTGDWLYSIALIVYVLEVTGSPAWVAITTVVRFTPVVLLGTFGGVIADRFDRKRVMIFSDLARCSVMIGLTVVALVEGPALAAAVLAGLSVTFACPYSPAVRAVVPTLVGEDDLTAANTLISTVENVSLALGPAVGGVLLLLGTPAAAFGLNAATFGVSIACNVAIRTSLLPPALAEGERVPPMRERLTAGFAAIGSSSAALLLVALSIVFTAVYGAEIVLYSSAAEGILGIGDDGLAFMWAATGVGGIAAASVTNRVASRPQLTSILAIAVLVAALPTICLSFVRNEAIVYGLLTIEGAAVIVADVVSVTLLQRVMPEDVLGRVFGIMDSLMVAGIVGGSLLATALLNLAGIEVALIASGGLLVAAALIALPRAARIDRDAAQQSEELRGRIALLDDSGIFEGASRPTLEALAAAARVEHLETGSVVIAEGDPADALFVVASGTLDVTARGSRSEATDLGTLTVGDHFGEIGLLERRPRTATVTVSTDGELLRIGGDDFLRAVSEPPRMSGRLIQTAATRLARTHPSERLAST